MAQAVGVAAPAAAPTASGGRILFVDLARAIAVLLMVFGTGFLALVKVLRTEPAEVFR